MLRSTALVVIVVLPSVARAEDPAALISRASVAYQTKDYVRSAALCEDAIKAGASPRIPAYNAACCYALLGRTDKAFNWLDKSLDAGWRDVDSLKSDSDFRSLHSDPRWGQAIERCQENRVTYLKSIQQPALREELLVRLKEDQRIRFAPKPDYREWHRIDGDNTAFMKKVIEKHGWPGKTLVGADGAQAAFMLVQHAASDQPFQKRCLTLLKVAVEQGEARASDMAYLEDRALVMNGRRQIYGTQFHTVHGKLVPETIEDEANVDARRRKVGLPPLAEYTKQVRSMQER